MAIASPTLFAKARELGLDTKQEVRAGPIKDPETLKKLGVWQVQKKLGKTTKRDVEFMVYKDELSTWRRGPSVHIK